MANFPALKTGVVAQYGSDWSRQFSTQVLRFLDGSEQRFPGYGAPLRKWVIRLDLLDESELNTLEVFFEDEGGRAGTFSFTDPWDQTVYANCSFDSDDLALEFQEAARGKTQVIVKENRT
jgi:phage-related protein